MIPHPLAPQPGQPTSTGTVVERPRLSVVVIHVFVDNCESERPSVENPDGGIVIVEITMADELVEVNGGNVPTVSPELGSLVPTTAPLTVLVTFQESIDDFSGKTAECVLFADVVTGCIVDPEIEPVVAMLSCMLL